MEQKKNPATVSARFYCGGNENLQPNQDNIGFNAVAFLSYIK